MHGELYTGITTDISRRFSEHNGGTGKSAKYTRAHKVIALEALWETENRSLASKLEWNIKRLKREQKLRIIECEDCFMALFPNLDSTCYHRVNGICIDVFSD